ncbi:MAG: hypothetical protein SVS15_04830 [Thermodesulfobacteriota bacterium]|nr:hypothetical protein [Thermodesulfobacteriota bacterium]
MCPANNQTDTKPKKSILKRIENDFRESMGLEKKDPPQRVVVTGIKISFWDVLDLMIKIGIAAIPATIVAYLVWHFLVSTLL